MARCEESGIPSSTRRPKLGVESKPSSEFVVYSLVRVSDREVVALVPYLCFQSYDGEGVGAVGALYHDKRFRKVLLFSGRFSQSMVGSP